MIRGIGTDIVDVARIERSIKKDNRFKDLVFSPAEIAYCERSKNFQSYAGKFAAKEAFMKALGTGWRGEMALHEIEVCNDDFGKPYLNILGKTKKWIKMDNKWMIHLSVSHTQSQAVAFVIIEENKNGA